MAALRLIPALFFLAASLLAAAYAAALFSRPMEGGGGLFPAQALKFGCSNRPDCPTGLMRAAAGHAPLGAAALEARLLSKYEAGETEQLAELARLVLSQDARSELARIILAEEALAEGDTRGFLKLFLPVFATDGRQSRIYADVLAQLSQDPALFAALGAYIRAERPYWGADYLNAVAERGALSLSSLIDLYAEFPPAQPGLLTRLAGQGNWPGAYLTFNEFLSGGALGQLESLPRLTIPYNPELFETPAPPPFNWRLHSRGAEWLPSGGVYAFFQGRRAETFLSQTFPLDGGRWDLSAVMSGEVSETGGFFRWQLTCAAGGRRIAALDVKRLSAAPEDQILGFEAPGEACRFVTLTLVGVAGSFPQPARIELRSVRLAPSENREDGL